ncbi:DDE-type integrase/transposase/recombinase [Stenotrophomonas maltophilia]|nr:DDE-type integrase/transposase/recombinase [Stenotrophomonas maltophilia]
MSARTVRRKLKAYLQNPIPASQLNCMPGPLPGSRRLAPVVESLIDRAIEEVYLSREKRPVAAVVRRLGRLAAEAGVVAPGRRAVLARIAQRDPLAVAKKRLGSHEGMARQAPSVNGLRVSRALEAVQIDHALVDLIVVSSVTRKPIGRPWLTVAIDVYTRCILGYYLSFDTPNQTSVAHTLEHAFFPKGAWMKKLGVDVSYPMFGKAECIHWDNAKTFQAKGVKAQCERYGIRIQERPVRSPHYGAYVERVIGTMMGAVHLLPGTTFSNVKARGDYSSEKRAAMSFNDLERWLAEEIAGHYHNRPHRGLGGGTPAAAWEDAWKGSSGENLIPPIIGDQRGFLLAFFPSVTRRVGRDGVVVNGLRYWDPCLAPLINDRQDHQIHFSQRDLSKVYLMQGDSFIDVPLLDRSQGAFSLWEVREARSELRARGRAAFEEAEVFEAIERQRSIVVEAERSSKAARKKIARMPLVTQSAEKPKVDYTRGVSPFSWDDGVVE